MTNEIKEIIDDLDYAKNKQRGTIILNQKDINLLLDYITYLQEREKEMIIQSNALSHYLIKQGSSYKDVVKIVDDFKLQGEEIMNDKIVPAIIENEGIKYIAIRFHIDTIDENRMLWTENEKLLQRIDKAIDYINDEYDIEPKELYGLVSADELLNILRGDE